MEYKKFKAFERELRVALTSGHVFIIPIDSWVEIPGFAWGAVFAAGATSEDTIKADSLTREVMQVVNIKKKVSDLKLEVKEVMKGWVTNNELDKFGANGKPKSPELGKAIGKSVTNAVRDEVWFLLQSELDPGEEG